MAYLAIRADGTHRGASPTKSTSNEDGGQPYDIDTDNRRAGPAVAQIDQACPGSYDKNDHYKCGN